MFVAFLACVAFAAADVSLIHPAGHLEPPVEHLPSKEFNAPWTEKNTWEPLADPHQPINVITNNNNNNNFNNNVAHDGYHYDNNNNNNFNNQNENYNNNYNNDYAQNNNQNYNQVATYSNHQSHQGHSTNTASHGQVAFEVTHPYWATSFAKINRFDTWPAAPAPFVAAAPVSFVAPTPATFVAPVIATNAAPFVKPVAIVSDHAAKWNPWNQHHQGWTGPVAKYVAITPGSVHIAPLPGHTVSQKILNLAPAATVPASW